MPDIKWTTDSSKLTKSASSQLTLFTLQFVYRYVRPACGAQYVGSTTRGLATRAAEHAGIIVWELESPNRSRLNPIYGTISSLVVDLKLALITSK